MAAAFALPSATAFAQAAHSQSITTRTQVTDGMQLSNPWDMDFGVVLVQGAGTIVMTPAADTTCTVTGQLIHNGTCVASQFDATGAFLRRIRIRKPAQNRIVLTGPGADMIVSNVVIGGETGILRLTQNGRSRNIRYLVINPDGTFTFKMGGTLTVAADQAPGLYTGQFEVNLDYD
ncbi:hypothetical protein HME9302_00168 [Alteripontixanthobacter maritimus]|uniref:DUF4402 domain-containing protein n=2 Tax=Alteripontixanthobacter maritimus TaxID=2161824 RepID=A0A369Q255_9SPHN|nr:hypothetical protein HME9302_00168 [Alteripontixanthobacter maritimus]